MRFHGTLEHQQATWQTEMTVGHPAAAWVFTATGWEEILFSNGYIRTYIISSILLFDSQSSVQFSHSVMSNTLQPHGLQHARPPCPSPTLRACSDSCPLSQWCHSTILPCHPLLLLPSIFPSIRVFSKESVLCIRWPNYRSFNFSISLSNEYSGLISFRIDWLDLLAVQGTLKSFLQHHISKVSILWCSAFFMSVIHTWLLEKPYLWLDGPLLAK